MNFDALLRLIGGDNIDRIGTALGARELGWSERGNNNQPTIYTGVTPQSQAAGLDKWRYDHFIKPKGSSNQVQGVVDVLSTTPKADPPGGGRNVVRPMGRNTDSGGGNVDTLALALADVARRNRINSYKAQAGNLRSNAQSTFNDILRAVNAFRERSKAQYENAGQEIINNASQILGSNARTAREAAGSARARARAMGLGDSSKFNLQNKVEGNLASTQGNIIARRGEEERANKNLFQERLDQAQRQEDEASTYLRNANDRAAIIENTGYDAADEVFGNALNDIVNYQRQLAAIRPVQAEGLTQYTPNFSGIVDTINGVLNGLGGGRGVTEQDMGNPVNPTNIFELLRRRGLVQG